MGAAVTRVRQAGLEGLALRRYIERQAGRSGETVQHVMLDYYDYLQQLDALGVRDGDAAPRDLRAAHERLSARQRKLTNRDKTRQFRVRRRLCRWMRWQHRGCLIRPVDSVEEIVREGEQQFNCVAGYADRHASGKTVILVLRRAAEPRESWCTVELDPQALEVRQCRGFRNSEADPEAQEFIELWTARLKMIARRKNA